MILFDSVMSEGMGTNGILSRALLSLVLLLVVALSALACGSEETESVPTPDAGHPEPPLDVRTPAIPHTPAAR